MQSVSAKQVHLVAQFQLGVINRSTRHLVACSEYDQLLEIVHAMAVNLELAGYVRVSGYEYSATRKIGLSGLQRESLALLPGLVKQTDKIVVNDRLMLCQWPSIVLVVDTEMLDESSRSQLQDSIAIALDTIQTWLDRHYELMATKANIYLQLFQFKNHLQEGMDCMNQQQRDLHCELISRIASHLPVLGLETDQEELILDTFSPIILEMDRGVSSHCAASQSFIELINQTLDYLSTVPVSTSSQESDANIVLF